MAVPRPIGLLLIACLALAACGAEGSGSEAPGSAPVTGSAVPTPGGSVGAARTLTGTVTAGVEPGCLLLAGYLLVGGPRDVLVTGARVTVTGEPVDG